MQLLAHMSTTNQNHRTERLAAGASITYDDIQAINGINARIVGYSNAKHYGFFKALFANEDIQSLLILGVYHGRDIAFMLSVLERYCANRGVQIVGVDKFTDTACADWPEQKHAMNWAQAGFGRAPAFETALRNVQHPNVRLIKSTDSEYLANTPRKFDVIYLDTSHDHETVSRQFRQIKRIANPGAVICGDDYSDESNAGGSWGVKRAVTEAFAHHGVFADWIWFARVEDLK